MAAPYGVGAALATAIALTFGVTQLTSSAAGGAADTVGPAADARRARPSVVVRTPDGKVAINGQVALLAAYQALPGGTPMLDPGGFTLSGSRLRPGR